MMEHFTFVHRGLGHWDVTNDRVGRIIRIRGTPGNVTIDWSEGRHSVPGDGGTTFKTVAAAMAHICDMLSFEPELYAKTER